MLRSLLLSGLRRHGCRPMSRLGRRAFWITSRGHYTSSEDETDFEDDHHPDAKPAVHDRYGCAWPSHARRHLYLVLDDWTEGFSMYKLDLDGSDGRRDSMTLPAPVHRQECRHAGGRPWNFASLASKIVAAGVPNVFQSGEQAVTLMYDTRTAGVSVVPRLLEGLRDSWTLAVAAGNGLNVFAVANDMHRLDAPKSTCGTREPWTWGCIPSSLPFHVGDIESSAVHPGGVGRTLFVSVGRWVRNTDSSYSKDYDLSHDEDENQYDEDEDEDGDPYDEDVSRTPETFSYMGSSQWRRHGGWDLPFYGQAHYDDDLEAWVGLHKIFRRSQKHMTDGYLSSCDVASPDGCPAQPACKLCTERLFDPDDDWHIGASLVYMGDNTYCLVELEARERFKKRHRQGVGHKCAVRLAIFRLKYGKNGELTITGRRPHRTYFFSRFSSSPNVRAFWM